MSDVIRERPKLDLGDDLDLSDFEIEVSPSERVIPSAAEVEEVSKNAGFPSRSAAKKITRRRRRKISPFQDQIGIKCRNGMKELFQELGDVMDTHDHTTFETAIQALLEKKGYDDLLRRFKRVTEAQ